jgi:hypothetical protein
LQKKPGYPGFFYNLAQFLCLWIALKMSRLRRWRKICFDRKRLA